MKRKLLGNLNNIQQTTSDIEMTLERLSCSYTALLEQVRDVLPLLEYENEGAITLNIKHQGDLLSEVNVLMQRHYRDIVSVMEDVSDMFPD